MFTGRSYTGVWTLPGMARHSCLPTANFVCFGDTMIARAARDLKVGDEVTFAFWDVLVPIETRRQTATEKCGGFWCRCPRCEAESEFGAKVDEASAKLKKRFDRSAKRVTAIKEQLMVKIEAKNAEMKKKFETFNRSDARKYCEGLTGLADKFRNLNGRTLTDEDLDQVREYLPENNEPEMVKVPPDLADDLFGAITDFEDELAASGLSEEHQRWSIASHLCYYGEVLVLIRLLRDLPAQRRLVNRMLPAVAAVTPGSFAHMRLCVFNWEVAAQCEDPALTQATPGREIAHREKQHALENLRLRYGGDLSTVEQEAAMARIAVSRELDENWCWEVSWCIGKSPQDFSPDGEEAGPLPQPGRIPSAPKLR